MLIDTHCHLNFQAFNNDLSDVVRRAQDAGVEKIIIPGTDLTTSAKAVEIAQKFENCWAAVGVHPHHAHNLHLLVNDELRQQLEKLLSQNRVVAMGEIGLDYFRYTKSKYSDSSISDNIKQKQKTLLTMQLDLALIHNLPVIFHCREAYRDMLQTLSTFSRTLPRRSPALRNTGGFNYIKPHHPPAGGLRGVFHCFTGSTSQLQLLMTMGYYIGFDGNITFSNYSTLVSSAPLKRILLETDSPYLTPVPYRGTRNEPKNLPLIADAVAKYQGLSPAEVIKASTQNAEKLFGI